MKPSEPWRLKSRIVHAGVGSDPLYGSVATPIYQTVTFQHPGSGLGPFDYSRTLNPTRDAVQRALADLEGGASATVFASGMAAITALLHLLDGHSHVVLTQDLYGGTFRVLEDIFARFGVEYTFVDTTRPDAVEAAWRPHTRLLFVETPSNPLLRVSDLDALAALAHRHDAWLAVDNTFMTFALQRPLDWGADWVLYSATKYLAGHNDVLAGAVVARDAAWGERLAQVANATGGVLGPMDCFLLLRGLKTLDVRLERQQANAQVLAERLNGHEAVAAVHYPSLDAETAQRHRRQARGFGAMVAFRLKNPAWVPAFMDHLRLVLPAVSLGGVESLITHPFSETHREFPEDRRLELGFVPGLMRLSVGIEDVEDLWADLKTALDAVSSREGGRP